LHAHHLLTERDVILAANARRHQRRAHTRRWVYSQQHTDLHQKESWDLAGTRLDDNAIGKELPPVRGAAKRKLLATIHGFYLQALARLPTAELRGRYHRSMLEGGHCYGPLDPVSNIIVNTVWYEQTFPASKQVTVDMISTKCLWRIAARSLYGLFSFLCTRYPGLSPDQALRRLQEAGANLATEAYAAAAAAAFHSSPLAQKEFLGSPDVVSRLKATSEVLHLQDGLMVSAEDLGFLSMVLLKCPSVGESHLQQQVPPAPVKVKKRVYANVRGSRSIFWGQHERVRSMVAAALDKFNETMVGFFLLLPVPKYRLHVICGVNELASGPEFSLDREIRGYNPWTPKTMTNGVVSNKYHHSHINFLATREGSPCAGAPATLFFAECSNHGTGTCWGVPVSPSHPDAGML
ncbi:hypothetical protein BAE44_0004881, partial [Dichanthelium oligosanthes]